MLACFGMNPFGKNKYYDEPATQKPEDTIVHLRECIDTQEKRYGHSSANAWILSCFVLSYLNDALFLRTGKSILATRSISWPRRQR
mmetsp:Transcript_35698/g.53216  ORF Transcript_35698/g.53216 Transcript_35698/m.53216 type:complete len:86 (-) Transcript_35698:636-893(-)